MLEHNWVEAMNLKMKLLLIGIILVVVLSANATTFYIDTISSAPKPIRVACIGDSITERSEYPSRLSLMLGRNYTVGNFGVSGSTVATNSKLPYMSQPAFQKAEEFHPQIVVIMLGTNDANPEISPNEESFETDYSQLVNAFEQLEGKQLIWIVKSPPIFSNNSSWNNTYLTSTVLPQIDSLANQMNLPTVDMYGPFGNHSDYFADGVHPNSDGATLIASHVYDAITFPDGTPDTSYFGDGYSG